MSTSSLAITATGLIDALDIGPLLPGLELEVQEGLGVAADEGQRCAQLMADRGHESLFVRPLSILFRAQVASRKSILRPQVASRKPQAEWAMGGAGGRSALRRLQPG